MLGVEEDLHAETAAHVGRDDAEGFLGQLKDGVGEQALNQPAALGVGAQREAPACGVERGGGGTGLHRGDDDAVVDHGQARDVRGLLEQLLGLVFLADLPVEHPVERRGRPDLGLALLHRGGEVGGRGEYFVFHADGFGGVACRLHRLGDDEGHGVADMADHAVGEHGMWRADLLGAVAVLQADGAGHEADAVGGQIRTGVDGAHAGHRGGGRDVDRENFRAGMGAAQHDAVDGPGQRDVVGVGAVAFEEARVFHPADGLGEAELGHDGVSGCNPIDSPSMYGPDPERQGESMFERYLALWRLTPDGEPVATRSSRLLPVRQGGRPAMLKIAIEDEEKAGGGADGVVGWPGRRLRARA